MYYYPAGAQYTQSMNQPTQMQPNNYYGIKGRPVSSIEEVRAAQVDFDGSLFVFPDIANKKIYTKQINVDGTASLNMYELTTLPQPAPTPIQNYVTKEEFEKEISSLKESFQKAAEGARPATEKKSASVASPIAATF